MERAEVLMLKLLEQFRKKEHPDLMMLTLQQVQQELAKFDVPASQLRERNKVSVVLPYRHKPLGNDERPPLEEKIVELLHVDESEVEKELEMMKQSAELKNEMGLKLRPPVQEHPEPDELLPPTSKPVQFDPMDLDEIPTLATHFTPEPTPVATMIAEPASEDVVTAASTELNEKLREPQKEVAQKLQDVPIRDLRKAIGINDRYLFINELFNGDEAMFERSVKTLNQFSILPEAEFWMQRELRIKLGWKEDNLLVQQFVQLVRRRFS
jgi:hypothetical protein